MPLRPAPRSVQGGHTRGRVWGRLPPTCAPGPGQEQEAAEEEEPCQGMSLHWGQDLEAAPPGPKEGVRLPLYALRARPRGAAACTPLCAGLGPWRSKTPRTSPASSFPSRATSFSCGPSRPSFCRLPCLQNPRAWRPSSPAPAWGIPRRGGLHEGPPLTDPKRAPKPWEVRSGGVGPWGTGFSGLGIIVARGKSLQRGLRAEDLEKRLPNRLGYGFHPSFTAWLRCWAKGGEKWNLWK